MTRPNQNQLKKNSPIRQSRQRNSNKTEVNHTAVNKKLGDIIRENENFETRYKTIAEYVKNQGFNLYYTKSDIFLDSYGEHELEWDSRGDWEGFLQFAEKAGCNMIVAVTAKFDKEFAMNYLQTKSYTTKVSLSRLQSLKLEELSRYASMIGAFKFFWIREGIEYSYIEEAEWFETIQESLLDLGRSVRIASKNSALSRRR